MVMVEGGTERDLAQALVSICFSFEPKGTQKTIEQILSERNIQDKLLRTLCQEETERMVENRFLHLSNDGNYAFSKDSQGRYSWQPATKLDVLRYRLRIFLN